MDTGRSLEAPTFRNMNSSRNENPPDGGEYGLSDLVQNYRMQMDALKETDLQEKRDED